MITMARTPSIKWLKTSNRKLDNEDRNTLWAEVGTDEILMHRSWNSLKLIIEWAKKCLGKHRPVLYMPEYYCYDTIYQIEEGVELVYYPICETLMPDMKACRELAKKTQPDLFIFVHFWGKIFDSNDVAVFCRQCNAVFIEDAVHVLAPERSIGQQSDFILFSPWKLLGLPDGAILIIGKKNHYQVSKVVLDEVLKSLDINETSKKAIFLWKCKRLVLKVLPDFPGKSPEHESQVVVPGRESLQQISAYSSRILRRVTKEELLEIGERRKENNLYVLEYCKRRYGAEPLFSAGKSVPYMAAIRVDDRELKEQIARRFNRIGRVTSTWPGLSPSIAEKSLAKDLQQDILAIAVHDNMSLDFLASRLKDQYVTNDKTLVVAKIDQIEYDSACSRILGILPMLQSSVYGIVKKNAQGWQPEYYMVDKGNEHIACFMVLKKGRLLTIYRINQGIGWLTSVDKSLKYEVYHAILKKFTGIRKILFLASREERAEDNVALMVRNGLKYRKAFASTGYIDLSLSEENLRKNLNSKWRNQLKVAEAQGLSIEYVTETAELEELLELHVQHKKEAKYVDSGDDITRNLIKQQALLGYAIREETGKVIAFIMVAIHGSSATYYIGWSSEEGYRLNLNKLLLWNAFLSLKSKGYHWFDLGGIDFIHTPGIAEFKMGTGCEYYETVGEFVMF